MQTCTGGMGTATLYWKAVEHPMEAGGSPVILAWLDPQVALENLSLQQGCASSPLTHEHAHCFIPEPGASYCFIKYLQHRFPVLALWEQ